jgi:hypothetical protein
MLSDKDPQLAAAMPRIAERPDLPFTSFAGLHLAANSLGRLGGTQLGQGFGVFSPQA